MRTVRPRYLNKSIFIIFFSFLGVNLYIRVKEDTEVNEEKRVKIEFLQCVSGIWTSLTWLWWLGFRLEPILGK